MRVLKLLFNPKLFNPLYWHIVALFFDYRIRYIFVEGGSSASKTFSICQAVIFYIMQTKTNCAVFRRFHVHIDDSVYASFKSAIEKMELTNQFIFTQDLIRHRFLNCRIAFKGLDNPESIKGLEDFDLVYNNEWNQFLEAHWKQQRKRLRGRPNQKFICDWNPVSAKMWLYENWIDLETWTDLPLIMTDAPTKYNSLNAEFAFKRINAVGNMVNIKVTFRDNFWVMGHPSGKGGFDDVETKRDFELDRLRDSSQYRIYGNGERGVIKTGGEFWKQFDPDKHVKAINYLPAPIHVSIDDNSIPYVTVTIWQVNGTEIRQVHELPCKSPDNNAPKAARKLIEWLNRMKHQNMVYVYGDPSSKKSSTVDENSRSFYDKFFEVLRVEGKFRLENRVINSAPEVALSAAFINDIYEFNLNGYLISIGDGCKVSIDDYASVKEAPDGTMLKPKVKDPVTGKMFEMQGHISDSKRYFIIELLKKEWIAYKSRKNNLVNQIGYFR